MRVAAVFVLAFALALTSFTPLDYSGDEAYAKGKSGKSLLKSPSKRTATSQTTELKQERAAGGTIWTNSAKTATQ